MKKSIGGLRVHRRKWWAQVADLPDLVDAEGKADTTRQGTVMERENTWHSKCALAGPILIQLKF